MAEVYHPHDTPGASPKRVVLLHVLKKERRSGQCFATVKACYVERPTERYTCGKFVNNPPITRVSNSYGESMTTCAKLTIEMFLDLNRRYEEFQRYFNQSKYRLRSLNILLDRKNPIDHEAIRDNIPYVAQRGAKT